MVNDLKISKLLLEMMSMLGIIGKRSCYDVDCLLLTDGFLRYTSSGGKPFDIIFDEVHNLLIEHKMIKLDKNYNKYFTFFKLNNQGNNASAIIEYNKNSVNETIIIWTFLSKFTITMGSEIIHGSFSSVDPNDISRILIQKGAII